MGQPKLAAVADVSFASRPKTPDSIALQYDEVWELPRFKYNNCWLGFKWTQKSNCPRLLQYISISRYGKAWLVSTDNLPVFPRDGLSSDCHMTAVKGLDGEQNERKYHWWDVVLPSVAQQPCWRGDSRIMWTRRRLCRSWKRKASY
jgi:hypothetical protein